MKIYNYSGKFVVDQSDGGFSETIKSDKIVKCHLKKFLDAVTSVPKNYYIYELKENTEESNTHTPTEVDKHGLFTQVERVFAYELYHRWSCKFFGNKGNWVINGEIGKYLEWFYYNGYDAKGKQKYPDLVLHKGQNNSEGHMLVCEIKRKDDVFQGIAEDLNKLCRFTCETIETQIDKPGRFFTPYNCGVYLIIHADKEKETKTQSERNDECLNKIIVRNLTNSNKIMELKSISISNEAKKIICVYSHWDLDGNYSLSYQSLYNILSTEEDFSNIFRNNVADGKEKIVSTEIVDADNKK